MNYFKNSSGLLIRFDDISENMKWEFMEKCEVLFDEYNIELEELDISIEKSRERYKKQYGAMESIVNSFKSTGEFLDSYMEAQNKD